MKAKCLVLLCACWCFTSNQLIYAQTATQAYPLTLIDSPFNQYGAPSMRQSMDISLGFYYFSHHWMLESMHTGSLKKIKPRYRPITLMLFDVLSVYFPPGVAWLHEEWHRSTLTRRQIDSYNEVYDLKFFASAIAVKDVLDEDLIALKRDHPAEMVRLHSAGIESEYEMNLRIERNQFFYNHNPEMQFILLLNHLNNIAYLGTCATPYGDSVTQDFLDSEDENIRNRDFTGLDCAAWVYDLFRPFEPYQDRGIHPSGVGINRYRTLEDLSTAETRYLRKQFALSFLNLVDPFLFNQQYFKWRDWRWNINMRHHLAPFGYNLGTNLFLKTHKLNVLLTGNLFVNREKTLPGVDASVYRYPTSLFGKTLFTSLRIGTWMQPKELLYTDKHWEIGGLASLRIDIPINWYGLEIFAETSQKTRGWVPGHDFLDTSYALKTGVALVNRN